MAQIQQINNTTSKSYSSTLNNNSKNAGGEQFDILQLSNPMKIQSSTEKESNNAQTTMGQKNLAPLSVQNAKDPTLAVDVIRDIIGDELIASASSNGYTELYGELEDLNKTLYLSPDDIVKELLTQEKQSTMFSGNPFYDKLRRLAAENPEIRESIAALLKNLNLASSREEMLNALSANMKFLSEYFAPNRSLSSRLLLLSKQWGAADAADNFTLLKNQTSELLKNVSDSLLNDERTQTLIPIVIHNLSKYNTNGKAIADAFSQLLSHLSSTEEKQLLTSDFVALLEKNFSEKELANILYNNYTTNQQKNQAENDIFSNKNINTQFLVNSDKISRYISTNLSDKDYLARLGQENFSAESYIKSMYLGKTDGIHTIENMLKSLIADDGMKSRLSSELSRIHSLDGLIEYLNGIIKEMPDVGVRQGLYDGLDEIINHMALNEQSFGKPDKPFLQPQSSIEALTGFVERNINHAALKSVENFNASNLLQGMINAPGVLTPLSHFIIPVQIDDTKAFGEVWVDNERGGGDNTKNCHIFLTFDADVYGRFEMDMYAGGKDVSISLLYPEGYGEDNASALKSKVSRVSAGLGYTTRSFNTAILSEPHSLTEIFPRLIEKRRGMDVQA